MKKIYLGVIGLVSVVFLFVWCNDSGIQNGGGEAVDFLNSFITNTSNNGGGDSVNNTPTCGSWSVKTQATCTDFGVETRTCTQGGSSYTETKDIPKQTTGCNTGGGGNIYTITFNANNGTVSQTGTTGTDGKLTSLPTPTRSNYHFDGWFTETSGGIEVTTGTVFTKNTTVYAQWTAVSTSTTYTITLNATGGSGSPTSVTTGTNGKLSSMPTAPKKDGYNFDGWYTATSGGTKITTDYPFSAHTIIYAQWTDVSSGGNDSYEFVELGGLKWMKKNLNIETADSWCYDNSADSCAKYGRLYTWNAAKTACPFGWVLPSRQDWNDLVTVAGGDVAGKKLKAISGWRDNGNGTDSLGFSALPGGGRDSRDYFYDAGLSGYWWTATEFSRDSVNAYRRGMGYGHGSVVDNESYKSYGFSVRCVKDE